MEKQSMQKSLKKLCILGSIFGRISVDFGRQNVAGTKIDQKSMPIAKSDFLKNRALAAAGARFLRFWGLKLGVTTD